MPHHLLLGLLREGEGVAAQILRDLGVELDVLRSAVLASVPPADAPEAESRGRVVRGRHGMSVMTAAAVPGFSVQASPDVRRLLMAAGARALDDGRTEIAIADVEEALRRWGGSEEPPRASAGN
jgi:hypothetical protein